MSRLVAFIVLASLALVLPGCEWIKLQHQLTQQNVNTNTNIRADQLSKEHRELAPEEKKEAIDKLRQAMLESIAESEKRAQEQINATQAKIKENIDAFAGLASSFGVPPQLINFGTGLALGQAVQNGTNKVATDAADRAKTIEDSVKTAKKEVAEVREASSKNATEVAALLSANKEIKEKFEALDKDLQKKLTDLRGTMDDKILDAFNTSKNSEEFKQRIKAILSESGLSAGDIKKLEDSGLPWEQIAFLLLGGGALGSAGGVVGNRLTKKKDEVDMHERVAGIESSVGLDGKRAKPYMDDLYEQIEAIKVAMQGKGITVATAEGPAAATKKCEPSITINNTNTEGGGTKPAT